MPTVNLMKEQKKQAMTAMLSYMAKRNAASPENDGIALAEAKEYRTIKPSAEKQQEEKELWTLE